MHTFEVWAPTPESVRVEVDGITHEMDRTDDGWWRAEVDCDNRARYGFVVDGETLPDPRSPRQPYPADAADPACRSAGVAPGGEAAAGRFGGNQSS